MPDTPTDDKPATAHYCGDLITGSRAAKLERLATLESLSDLNWEICFSAWQDPLLPEREGNYYSWPLLTDLFPWQHSGIQFKRTWPISPQRSLLEQRWTELTNTPKAARAELLRSTGARNPSRTAKDLNDPKLELPPLESLSPESPNKPPQRLAYRSFDRQWMLPDPRLIDRPRPPLWQVASDHQVFFTSLLTGVLGEGPAAIAAAQIPDLHHFRGSFGAKDAIPLWRDSEGRAPNILRGLLDLLGREIEREVAPEDLFAYVYAVLSGDYTSRFATELEVPGPRIPITKDACLMAEAAELGGRLIWLHTHGERFVPPGEKFGEIPPGNAKCTAAVPTDSEHYPEAFIYDEDKQRLRVGEGVFAPVGPGVWNFSVSGLQVVRSWLSYRMKEGAGKRSSPLDEIRPQTWSAPLTEELCLLLWIIEQTVALIPSASKLLDRIVEGPVFTAEELPTPTAEERAAPKRQPDAEEQLSLDGDRS